MFVGEGIEKIYNYKILNNIFMLFIKVSVVGGCLFLL